MAWPRRLINRNTIYYRILGCRGNFHSILCNFKNDLSIEEINTLQECIFMIDIIRSKKRETYFDLKRNGN